MGRISAACRVLYIASMQKARMKSILPTQPGEDETDPFQAALATWLQSKAATTRHLYGIALRGFFRFVDKHPKAVTGLDVERWKEYLRERGYADTTIDQRLSALSSYYVHLQQPGADGTPLLDHNPAEDVERYQHVRKVSAGQFRRILDVIPVDTEKGARDRAMFLFYVLCARRRSEVVNLRGRDPRVEGERVKYRARLKRDKAKWKELPPPVWDAIRRYLDLADRGLTDDGAVFTATVDGGEPLSGDAVAYALKGYAAEAGLDPDEVTISGLRHLGAELFYQASGDLRETQRFLDHAQPGTTRMYLEKLGIEGHRRWRAMADALDL